jgi:hypothetical protein
MSSTQTQYTREELAFWQCHNCTNQASICDCDGGPEIREPDDIMATFYMKKDRGESVSYDPKTKKVIVVLTSADYDIDGEFSNLEEMGFRLVTIKTDYRKVNRKFNGLAYEKVVLLHLERI